MDGVLLIDKPAGITSHDAVAAVRRALGGAKTGHAGTLDPFATGLLLILVGRATKAQSTLMGLPKRYETRLPEGPAFGEALLAPSTIYVAFVRECQRRGLKLNYLSHVTGHGWRKLMRLEEPFVYEITTLRRPPPVFRFLMEAGPIDPREAYATFNMGVGFAAFVAPALADATLAAARATGYDAWLAGRVRKEGDRRATRYWAT